MAAITFLMSSLARLRVSARTDRPDMAAAAGAALGGPGHSLPPRRGELARPPPPAAGASPRPSPPPCARARGEARPRPPLGARRLSAPARPAPGVPARPAALGVTQSPWARPGSGAGRNRGWHVPHACLARCEALPGYTLGFHFPKGLEVSPPFAFLARAVTIMIVLRG